MTDNEIEEDYHENENEDDSGNRIVTSLRYQKYLRYTFAPTNIEHNLNLRAPIRNVDPLVSQESYLDNNERFDGEKNGIIRSIKWRRLIA